MWRQVTEPVKGYYSIYLSPLLQTLERGPTVGSDGISPRFIPSEALMPTIS